MFMPRAVQQGLCLPGLFDDGAQGSPNIGRAMECWHTSRAVKSRDREVKASLKKSGCG